MERKLSDLSDGMENETDCGQRRKEPKFRHELKYLCSDAQLQMLKSRLNGIMCLDPHVGEDGVYIIKSLYFDDYQNRCYYENENGTSPREKFRIRIYNNQMDNISLERKRKVGGKIQKHSCKITQEQYEILTSRNHVHKDAKSYPELMQTLLCLQKTRLMEPKVIVEYERCPYIYRNGNVRVTLDRNVRSSSRIDRFFEENIYGRQISPIGQQLLEVKYDEYLPDHIYRSLQLDNMQLTAFSKYYLCRKYTVK